MSEAPPDILPAKVAVFGASGQVGRRLVARLGRRAIPLSRDDADFERPETLPEVLAAAGAGAVINAAAYTAVDGAEAAAEAAARINGVAPAVLAEWCATRGVPLLQFSTDYVFPGTGEAPWRESDPVDPVNVYGATKLAGERAVAAAGGHWLILRTSWVYDGAGRNFLRTILRLAAENDEISVVDDQVGAPTFAESLAAGALQALAGAIAAGTGGLYHLCNAGSTSWHGFASAIVDGARARGAVLRVRRVLPVATATVVRPAARPANSRLDTTRIGIDFGVKLPVWYDDLNHCLDQIVVRER